MTKPSRKEAAAILLLMFVPPSCRPAPPQQVLTVEEVVPRIDELNGETVSVAGYLAHCLGYECVLYRNKEDYDSWYHFVVTWQTDKTIVAPRHPTLSIGRGKDDDFDAKAARFQHGYVVITGTITNECRFEGEPACTDRGPDLEPRTIRAGRAPAR
jgi:hypothetical protein